MKKLLVFSILVILFSSLVLASEGVFEYDDAGRIKSITYLNNSEDNIYYDYCDPSSELVKTITSTKFKENYDCTTNFLLSKEDLIDSKNSVYYTYSNNNLIKIQRDKSLNRYQHDTQGRLKKEGIFYDGNLIEFKEYTYDSKGNILSYENLYYKETYSYDSDDNLIKRCIEDYCTDYYYNDQNSDGIIDLVKKIDSEGMEVNFDYDSLSIPSTELKCTEQNCADPSLCFDFTDCSANSCSTILCSKTEEVATTENLSLAKKKNFMGYITEYSYDNDGNYISNCNGESCSINSASLSPISLSPSIDDSSTSLSSSSSIDDSLISLSPSENSTIIDNNYIYYYNNGYLIKKIARIGNYEERYFYTNGIMSKTEYLNGDYSIPIYDASLVQIGYEYYKNNSGNYQKEIYFNINDGGYPITLDNIKEVVKVYKGDLSFSDPENNIVSGTPSSSGGGGGIVKRTIETTRNIGTQVSDSIKTILGVEDVEIEQPSQTSDSNFIIYIIISVVIILIIVIIWIVIRYKKNKIKLKSK